MKWFFELGNAYAKQSDWKDFALTKFCLCAIGVIIGALVPQAYKTPVIAAAAAVFVVTYIPLMVKLYRTARQNAKKAEGGEQTDGQ